MKQDNKEQKIFNDNQMVATNLNNKIESPKPSTSKADLPKSITSQTESTMSSDDSQKNLDSQAQILSMNYICLMIMKQMMSMTQKMKL